MPGAILKYDEEKGFGFIKPDRGSEAGDSCLGELIRETNWKCRATLLKVATSFQDIFVHFSSLPRDYQRGGSRVLQPGDRAGCSVLHALFEALVSLCILILVSRSMTAGHL